MSYEWDSGTTLKLLLKIEAQLIVSVNVLCDFAFVGHGSVMSVYYYNHNPDPFKLLH